MPRPVLVVELPEGAAPTDPLMLTTLRAAVHSANSLQPSYSAILPQHVWLVPSGSLPRTVKGTVQRLKVEQMLREGTLLADASPLRQAGCAGGEAALTLDPTRSIGEPVGDARAVGRLTMPIEGALAHDKDSKHYYDRVSVAIDSLQGVPDKSQTATAYDSVRAHLYLFSMALVLIHHMPKLREGCTECGLLLGTLERLGEAAAMPTFCVLAGVRDRQLTSSAAMCCLLFELLSAPWRGYSFIVTVVCSKLTPTSRRVTFLGAGGKSRFERH
jgi:hypothetical protein